MDEPPVAAETSPVSGRSPAQRPPWPALAPCLLGRALRSAAFLALALAVVNSQGLSIGADDTSLTDVQDRRVLRYGCDAEGGGPYAYPDPNAPERVTGFEVEMMGLLTGALGPKSELYQGAWDALLQTLDAGHVDVVVNGYELTPERSASFLATRPYYVFQLQLMVKQGSSIRSFDDLKRPKPGGGRWQVAVLGSSTAETFATEQGGDTVEAIYFNGATDGMMAVANGQADATLQDYPAAVFYKDSYPTLEFAGEPVGKGYYVMYLRKGDQALRDALDEGIGRLVQTGALRTIFERYGIWTPAQDELAALDPLTTGTREQRRGLSLIVHYWPVLRTAAWMTVKLAVTSMPLAMLLGLGVALGRLYGPKLLAGLLASYVEFIRGTPLMLQLYVLFFLFPQLGIRLDPFLAGVLGLAINYSAYEAEIYRAGLQAIPSGQMEASLALGMSRPLALRRVVVPQAVRLVVPPVTNDFIALFKDTSVCSVISLVELTKRYSILANSTNAVVEFGIAASVLYLAMSLPLSWVSRRFEVNLGPDGAGKGALA